MFQRWGKKGGMKEFTHSKQGQNKISVKMQQKRLENLSLRKSAETVKRTATVIQGPEPEVVVAFSGQHCSGVSPQKVVADGKAKRFKRLKPLPVDGEGNR